MGGTGVRPASALRFAHLLIPRLLAIALLAFIPVPAVSGDDLGVVVDFSTSAAIVFDADTDTIVGSVLLGAPGESELYDCSVTPDQSLAFVSDFSGRRIFVIDLNGPSLATGINPIPVSVQALDTTITADQRFLLVSGSVSTIAPSGISVVDIASRREIGLLEGTFMSVESSGDGSVLATSLLDDSVHRLQIDGAGNLTDTSEILLLSNAFNAAFAPHGGSAVVVSNNLLNSVLRSVTYPPVRGVDTRRLDEIGISVVVHPRGDRVFTRSALFSGSSVRAFAYDPATGALGPTASLSFPVAFTSSFLGVEQLALHPQEEKLYVPEPGVLKVHDATTGMVLASVAGPINPRGVCLRPAAVPTGNRPPVSTAGLDETFECVSSEGAPGRLDGSGSSDPDSTPGTNDDIILFEWFEGFGLPTEVFLGDGEILDVDLALGGHVITLRVTDKAGATDTDEVVKTVVDTVPPELALTVDPASLWPPNHRLVDVMASVTATDACSTPSIALLEITSDEPDDAPGRGDGNAQGDIQDADYGSADFKFKLRAERDGAGDGRTYTVRYRATDAAGNTAEDESYVNVPHDKGGKTDP